MHSISQLVLLTGSWSFVGSRRSLRELPLGSPFPSPLHLSPGVGWFPIPTATYRFMNRHRASVSKKRAFILYFTMDLRLGDMCRCVGNLRARKQNGETRGKARLTKHVQGNITYTRPPLMACVVVLFHLFQRRAGDTSTSVIVEHNGPVADVAELDGVQGRVLVVEA